MLGATKGPGSVPDGIQDNDFLNKVGERLISKLEQLEATGRDNMLRSKPHSFAEN